MFLCCPHKLGQFTRRRAFCLSVQKLQQFLGGVRNGGSAGILHILYGAVAPGYANGGYAVGRSADHIVLGVTDHNGVGNIARLLQKIGDDLGFFGAALVITLFVLLLWRGYKIASKAPDKFTSLVVYGLTTKIALQTVLNIAVVTNSMPNTGISLPFFSSGGTALMLQIFEMGIILSISRYSYVKK